MSSRYKLGTVEVDGAPAAALFVGDDVFALGDLAAAMLSSDDRKGRLQRATGSCWGSRAWASGRGPHRATSRIPGR